MNKFSIYKKSNVREIFDSKNKTKKAWSESSFLSLEGIISITCVVILILFIFIGVSNFVRGLVIAVMFLFTASLSCFKPREFYRTNLTYIIMKILTIVTLFITVISFIVLGVTHCFNHVLGKNFDIIIKNIWFCTVLYGACYILVKPLYLVLLKQKTSITSPNIWKCENLASHLMITVPSVSVLYVVVIFISSKIPFWNFTYNVLEHLLLLSLCLFILIVCMQLYIYPVTKLVNTIAIYIVILAAIFLYSVFNVERIENKTSYLLLGNFLLIIFVVCVINRKVILEKIMYLKYALLAREINNFLFIILVCIAIILPPTIFVFMDSSVGFTMLGIYITLIFLIIRGSYKEFIIILSITGILIVIRILVPQMSMLSKIYKVDINSVQLKAIGLYTLILLNMGFIIKHFMIYAREDYCWELLKHPVLRDGLLIRLENTLSKKELYDLIELIQQSTSEPILKRYGLNEEEVAQLKKKYFYYYSFNPLITIFEKEKIAKFILYKKFLDLNMYDVKLENVKKKTNFIQRYYGVDNTIKKLNEEDGRKLKVFVESVIDIREVSEDNKKAIEKATNELSELYIQNRKL